ncbi:hypothetical protein H4P1_00056 (plasmid) [Variovorax sp. PBS-H4]|uniref:DUF6790 family protein n=1 Tax=Variovorax sp. PBS-H4 TaxID=434008 RepID=UPI0013198CFD|nr:DUF6790 family protein [Variovorax sp. PBS-H4]VTU41424.1 hypothetical protein H4P1_00056 [Variovorax sp. PBS-H4]
MTTPARTTPATSKIHTLLGGILPFIGLILFTVATVIQLASGLDHGWQQQMLGNAVTYLIGWAMLGAGVAHLLFGKHISKTIGFKADRYEFEVGAADFSMGLVALLVAGSAPQYWWAIILASSIYRVLCGIGHIRSMIQDRNFTPNNTAILFINFAVPVFLVAGYLAWT